MFQQYSRHSCFTAPVQQMKAHLSSNTFTFIYYNSISNNNLIFKEIISAKKEIEKKLLPPVSMLLTPLQK